MGAADIMLCELVQTKTPDHVRLHGAWFRSPRRLHDPSVAALLLSGLAGNFYSSRLLQSLGRHLLDRGIHVLHANTRGHDGINWLSVGGRTIANGAAFERVDESQHDVTGWVGFLASRDIARIAVVGHSLGAIKALYAQAHQPSEFVSCIAALSASRLNYEQFMASPHAERFEHWHRMARSLVDAGKPDSLLRVDFPFPAFIAANAYLHKYGPENRLDWTRFIHRIDRPLLLIFGERELQTNAAFQGLMDQVSRAKDRMPQLETQIVPSADHFYVGRRQVVSRWTADWIEKTISS